METMKSATIAAMTPVRVLDFIHGRKKTRKVRASAENGGKKRKKAAKSEEPAAVQTVQAA